jgi:hypothetical protein
MPRKAIDYSKTIMYKIVCKDIEIRDINVGQTTEFTKRKYNNSNLTKQISLKHNDPCNRILYDTVRNNGGWDNWSMIKIENYPCETRLDAESRERYWMEELKSNLNKLIRRE